jgi:hypothetical protein
MKAVALVFTTTISLFAQSKTVFMITDAEGVAGVCRQEQTDPKNAEIGELPTGEINSAVAGFFRGTCHRRSCLGWV